MFTNILINIFLKHVLMFYTHCILSILLRNYCKVIGSRYRTTFFKLKKKKKNYYVQRMNYCEFNFEEN